MTRPAVIILSEQAAATGRAIADAIGGELAGARRACHLGRPVFR